MRSLLRADSRAQTLSVNTLIVVALGILILIIGALMINKYWDGFDDTSRSCTNQGGTCSPIACADLNPPQLENELASCPDAQQHCCIGSV